MLCKFLQNSLNHSEEHAPPTDEAAWFGEPFSILSLKTPSEMDSFIPPTPLPPDLPPGGQRWNRVIFGRKNVPKPLRNNLLTSHANSLGFEVAPGSKFIIVGPQTATKINHFHLDCCFFEVPRFCARLPSWASLGGLLAFFVVPWEASWWLNTNTTTLNITQPYT